MADQQRKKGKSGPKHPKPHKGIRNTDRPNGKAWKRGKAPADR